MGFSYNRFYSKSNYKNVCARTPQSQTCWGPKPGHLCKHLQLAKHPSKLAKQNQAADATGWADQGIIIPQQMICLMCNIYAIVDIFLNVIVVRSTYLLVCFRFVYDFVCVAHLCALNLSFRCIISVWLFSVLWRLCAHFAMWLCSTSLPGGSQVDGLPPAWHQTFRLKKCQCFFVFSKFIYFIKLNQKSNYVTHNNKLLLFYVCGSALRVFPTETRLTVYRRLDIHLMTRRAGVISS